MKFSTEKNIFQIIKKSFFLLTGIILFFYFLNLIKFVILFFLAAFIFSLILMPFVNFLEQKNIPRVLGTIIVLFSIFVLIIIPIWLILPTLTNEGFHLLEQFPHYLSKLSDNLEFIFNRYPLSQKTIELNDIIQAHFLPILQNIIEKIGIYIFSILNILLFLILFLSVTAYTLINPKPLLKTYLYLFPPTLRKNATTAFIKGTEMIDGWMKSVIIIGIIESIVVTIFLSFLGLPGAILWGLFAFFAELIPKISAYVMTIPPFLIALAIDPVKAIWVLIFYIILNEIAGDIISPKIRSSTMNIHPVFSIFMLLAMGYTFGFLGILIATPVSGFIKAFWEEFYLNRQVSDKNLDENIDKMIYR